MSSLGVEASLIVATFQLLAVRAVTSAIQAADKASAITEAGQKIAAARNATYTNRPRVHSEPTYQPGQHFHGSPVYEARLVIHPHPRVEQLMLAQHHDDCHWQPIVAIPSQKFIQPPWKTLPWENPPQPRQTVKIHPHHTDVISKGTMLDLFV